MKKFKRAVIQGGSLKGARYSDVNEADLRRGSKGYRGDQRFAQFCKQWVAATVVAPDEVLKIADSNTVDIRKSDSLTGGKNWKAYVKDWGRVVFNWMVGQIKGRSLTACVFLLMLLIIICRPAFGRLCGKVVGLSIRVFVRRVFGLVTVVLDSLLEEAASQVEQALLPSTFADVQQAGLVNPPVPQTSTSLQWTMHILCILVGSLLGRSLPRAMPAALESAT